MHLQYRSILLYHGPNRFFILIFKEQEPYTIPKRDRNTGLECDHGNCELVSIVRKTKPASNRLPTYISVYFIRSLKLTLSLQVVAGTRINLCREDGGFYHCDINQATLEDQVTTSVEDGGFNLCRTRRIYPREPRVQTLLRVEGSTTHCREDGEFNLCRTRRVQPL